MSGNTMSGKRRQHGRRCRGSSREWDGAARGLGIKVSASEVSKMDANSNSSQARRCRMGFENRTVTLVMVE